MHITLTYIAVLCNYMLILTALFGRLDLQKAIFFAVYYNKCILNKAHIELKQTVLDVGP